MKSILFALAILFSCLQLNAQSLADLNTPKELSFSGSQWGTSGNLTLPDYQRHRHCWGVRAGKTLMIIGAVEVLLGGALLATTKRNPTDPGPDFGTVMMTVEGAVLAGIGGLMYGFGRMHEHNFPERFSIIGNTHQFGIAYRL